MNAVRLVPLKVITAMLIGFASVSAQETETEKQGVQLSPQLMELLRAEMRALLGAVQPLPAGIATADWKGVAETSAQISSSYILDQKLTPAQRKELETELPEYFKRLDAEFHREAAKLEAAATDHDAQLAAFHYYRLIESCTVCHSAYATSRFPGFARDSHGGHGH